MNDVTGDADRARDRHLFGPGPKRLLALDGGGVRGAITVAFLERIEEILSADEKKKTALSGDRQAQQPGEVQRRPANDTIRLGDWFDLVGGTSTGAIIAGALALGYRTDDVKDFYLRLAPRAFRRPLLRVPYLQAKFDARALRTEIEKIVQERTLDSRDLITGLAVITKRMDTGSPWILANNRKAPYWETELPDAKTGKKGHTGNKDYTLAHLLRASTAAPHFFDPEVLPISKEAAEDPLGGISGHPWFSLLLTKIRALYGLLSPKGPNAKTHGLFIDGGVTPYNNPTLALLMMAVLKPFGLCWPIGPDKLTIVSIGTGTYRTKLSFAELGFAGPLRLALRALLSLMGDSENLALAQMQWLGDCPTPWTINREIGTLSGETPPGGHWFRFLRYDVRLEQDWLTEHLGLDLTQREVDRFRRMDDPGIIKCIYGIARLAAEKQVKPEHLLGDHQGTRDG
jgi:uncharacterized protein